MRSSRVIAIAALALYAIGVAYTTLNVVLRAPAQYGILPANTLAFFVFAVTHASDRLGVRAMLVFLVITFVVSFVFETVGVLTGVVYGPYHYTDRLGLKLGGVPVLIPLAWFMMMYASYTLVDIIAGSAIGRPVRERFGWLATTFTVFFLFRVYEVTQPSRPMQFDNAFAYLPVIAYAIQGLATISIGVSIGQHAPALITFFATGAFLFVAVTQLVRERIISG